MGQLDGRVAIATIASDTAYKGVPDMFASVTSKAALLGFARTLARELGPHGICQQYRARPDGERKRANSGRTASVNNERIIAARSIPRPQEEGNLIGTVIGLPGPGSDFVTGQTIAVEGGATFL